MIEKNLFPEQAGPLPIPAREPTRARTWTGDTEWYTPPWLLESAAQVMGAIDLDPAATDNQQAASPVKAARYFTLVDDGLAQPWHGRVFMNPPYARGWIDKFTNKFLAEYRAGRMLQGVLLTNSATDTKWWANVAGACDAICFLHKRVRFLKVEDGKLTPGSSSPSHPHCVSYFGSETTRFAKVFGNRGLVFPRPITREIAD
jgi:phage N-6-adenine-methyltransferase